MAMGWSMMVGPKGGRVAALFTAHPSSVGETYLQHLAVAAGFAGRMMVGSMVCFVHGLLPFLFRSTGSAIIEDLHRRMVLHRRRRAEQLADTEPGPESRAAPVE
jgi:hypothetical protein